MTDLTGSSERAAASWVRVERHGGRGHVVEIVLDRPDALNAVSTAMAAALTAAAREVTADESVRCVVLSSSQQKAFCVGADLKERHTFTDAQLVQQRPGNRAAYGAILALPVPAVAAVEGYALGGGFELALSCDLVVAGEGAVVGLPEVSVGVIPGGGGTQLLTRRVGWSRAAALIFTARRLTAAEALAHGCVDEVVATGSARDRALELAFAIAENSPVGLRQAKRAMRLGSDLDLEAGLEIEDNCWRQSAFSRDRAEGVAAFAQKRRPDWPGR
ncbi:MAG: enoyl-CoA hydratase-related protein [Lapillicoccus sp.]